MSNQIFVKPVMADGDICSVSFVWHGKKLDKIKMTGPGRALGFISFFVGQNNFELQRGIASGGTEAMYQAFVVAVKTIEQAMAEGAECEIGTILESARWEISPIP